MSVLNGRIVNGVKMKVMLADPPREESHKRLRTYWRKWRVSFLLHGTLVCFFKKKKKNANIIHLRCVWFMASFTLCIVNIRIPISPIRVSQSMNRWSSCYNPAGTVTFNTHQIEVVLVTPQTHVHVMVRLWLVLCEIFFISKWWIILEKD